jgi:hypothetical protein
MNYELNPILIEQQQLVPAEIAILTGLHERKDTLFMFAKMMDPNNRVGLYTLKYMAEVLQQLEFTMQKAWHFDMDRDKHSWWCLIPHCECNPQYTSIFPVRATSAPCKIHGAH